MNLSPEIMADHLGKSPWGLRGLWPATLPTARTASSFNWRNVVYCPPKRLSIYWLLPQNTTGEHEKGIIWWSPLTFMLMLIQQAIACLAPRITLYGQTGHTGLPAGPLCAARRVCISSSLQRKKKKDISAECVNQRWRPGLASRLCGRPPPPTPLSLPVLNSPPTPSTPTHPPPHNWLWKMASVSHLGTKIKGKLQPTSMQNVIWKPPSYVLTIDFSLSSSSPSLSLCPFLLISLLHFYRSTILRSVKFEEKKGPPEPYSRWNRKERRRGRGDSPWLCLFAFRVHFVM